MLGSQIKQFNSGILIDFSSSTSLCYVHEIHINTKYIYMLYCIFSIVFSNAIIVLEHNIK